MALGFVGLARFFPPPSPALSAEETAALILGDSNTIRWGMIVTMAAAVLLGVFAVVIAIQIRRIEGRFPVLSMIEFGLGMLFVLEFLYLLFFWQTATFRADRDAKLIELLNDMAWIPFVGLTGTAAVQVAAFGVAILIDRRTVPVFPRWLGYCNLLGGTDLLRRHVQRLLQNRSTRVERNPVVVAPVLVFAMWLVVVSVYLLKAIDSHISEATTRNTAGQRPHPCHQTRIWRPKWPTFVRRSVSLCPVLTDFGAVRAFTPNPPPPECY